MTDEQRHEFLIPETLAGKRLDRALAELFPEYSRTRIKNWIESGYVTVDSAPVKPKTRLEGGESVLLVARLEPETRAAPEPIPLDVVFEDGDILVVDKPAGLVVHPGAGNPGGTLQNAVLNHAPDNAILPRSGIVHRIDKDTTGLLVIAKSPRAHTELVRRLEAREIHREYRAVCVGVMTGGGKVDAPVGRHPVDRVRMTVRPDGRPAVTNYRVLERFRGHTFISATLESGRTHQIRVHMAHIRYPLVGDPVYGRRLVIPKGVSDPAAAALRGFHRQALHAYRLELRHPVSGEPMSWTAPLPDDFERLLDVLRTDVGGGA